MGGGNDMSNIQQMHQLYGRLYDALTQIRNTYSQDAVSFTAMEGCKYKSSKDTVGKDFRLMLVGRAVNGWDEYRGTGANTKERFITSSLQNLLNDPAALTHGKDRFEWIAVDEEHNIARNCVREGIGKEPCAVGDYCLSRPFWGYSKEIWDTLYGAATRWQERWYQKIIWTNLYKIAPRKGGNPSEAWQKMQREVCVELLHAEIEFFNPTHILFMTGTDWFQPFRGMFQEVAELGVNHPSKKDANTVYAELLAAYKAQNGIRSKVIVACRPEMREKHAYVAQVSKFLR